MDALSTAKDVLAAKRITRLIVDDAILDPIRERVWKRFPAHEHGPGFILTCHSCASVYAAAIVATSVLPRWVRDILALSEAVLIVQKFTDE